MSTILHTEIHNWWDGKVIIDEIKEFTDSRGSVFETWRTDEEKYEEWTPKMCYSSFTKPYIMRGPHQHTNQCDYFFTYKNKMVYHLYNPETKEMKIYNTDPSKIIRVKVAPPIIHSYRNLESKEILTSNFPSSLFMGENKKEEIDEIRHEHVCEKNKNFIVFGSKGRLGKALTKYLFDNMEFHKHNVIPIDLKIKDNDELLSVFNDIDVCLKDEKGNLVKRDVVFINCSGFSNVQAAGKFKDVVTWVNSEMPISISTECAKREWKTVHFSSDYVYQSIASGDFYDELGEYTKSKILMEDLIKRASKAKTNNTLIIRIANLYSTDAEDTHTIVGKLQRLSAGGKEKIKIVDNTLIMPTNVERLAKVVYEILTTHKQNNLSFINVVPDEVYKLEDFLCCFYGVSKERLKIREKKLNNWENLFIDSEDAKKIILHSNAQDILDVIGNMNSCSQNTV